MGWKDCSHALEKRIAEEGAEPKILVAARALEIHEAIRIANRQRSENDGVNQRECSSARTDREAERHDGSRRHTGVLAQHPNAEADVARDRVKPRQEFHVTARFTDDQAIAELSRGAPACITAALGRMFSKHTDHRSILRIGATGGNE